MSQENTGDLDLLGYGDAPAPPSKSEAISTEEATLAVGTDATSTEDPFGVFGVSTDTVNGRDVAEATTPVTEEAPSASNADGEDDPFETMMTLLNEDDGAPATEAVTRDPTQSIKAAKTPDPGTRTPTAMGSDAETFFTPEMNSTPQEKTTADEKVADDSVEESVKQDPPAVDAIEEPESIAKDVTPSITSENPPAEPQQGTRVVLPPKETVSEATPLSDTVSAPTGASLISAPSALPIIAASPSNDTNFSDINTVEHTSGENIRLCQRVEFLEMELAKAESMVETMQVNNAKHDDQVLVALQNNLQQQMSQKAEAENKCRLLEQQLAKLQTTQQDQSQEMEQLRSLQANLETQMSQKAEAENKGRLANEQIQSLEKENSDKDAQLAQLQQELEAAQKASAQQEQELEKVRAQCNAHERKEIVLTNRLNAAKKKEANEANLTEAFEDEIKVAQQAAEAFQQELDQIKAEKSRLEKEVASSRGASASKLRHLEASLSAERKLNDERKKKMKAFIENKTEELTKSKDEADSLRQELNESNKSLMDINNRWKQLHAQWMQAQTRNRELQRDLNKIKQDSEKMHRQGDTLEMKLSKSATEAEDHKNKRLAAKHELMSVLKQLEAEQELGRKLRNSLKFSFTPKALSQQQLLSEYMDDFEAQLSRLSLRLGKVLPPVNEAADTAHQSFQSEEDITVEENGDTRRSDAILQDRIVAKLEYETQRVSQGIMHFANGIERMHQLLDAGGDRSCFTALQEILATGTVSSVASSENAPMTGLRSIRSHSYGQIPSAQR